MRVRVLYFQVLRDAAGCAEEEFTLPVGATAGDAWAAAVAAHPTLDRFGRSVLFAVNEEWAKSGAPLSDGCTVALMPPVSGG